MANLLFFECKSYEVPVRNFCKHVCELMKFNMMPWCPHFCWPSLFISPTSSPTCRGKHRRFFRAPLGFHLQKSTWNFRKKTFISKHWNSSCIIQIWLVVQLFHLEKSWSSSMGFGWHPIYEMEKKTYVWNHQPEIQLRLSTTLRRHSSVSFPPATSLAKSPRIHDCSAADASGPGGADLSFDINLSMGNFSIKHNILSIYITGYYWLLFAIIGYIIGYYWL